MFIKYLYFVMLSSFMCRVVARKFSEGISHKMDGIQNFKNISWCTQNWILINTNNGMNKLLEQCRNVSKEETIIDVNDLITKSDSFPIPFPINTTRLTELKKRKLLEKLTYIST